MEKCSKICEFYENQNVFITGGTGFMGKVLIEKLLRSTKVSTLYILIREKKGKNVHSRLNELLDSAIFEKLKKEDPKFGHRLFPIAGDCSIPGLGLSTADREKLILEVNIVFHVAATVRFDENLKIAYNINVNGISDVVELSEQMKNLKSIVHVSTAYSNCHLKTIDETFYDYPIHYENLKNLLEKMTIDEAAKITPSVLGNWPNTYTFTKALAEALIKKKASNLPIGIFRPAIVTSTYKEPVEGWVDNLYGPAGVASGALTGLIRVFPVNSSVVADMVPVDTCIAGLIASAWDVAEKRKQICDDISIYNYVSSVENPITWKEFNTLNRMYSADYPFLNAIWTIKFMTISHYQLYIFLRILVHLIPAFFIDTILILVGQKPKLLSMYTKIHKFSDVLYFFGRQEWDFKNDNIIKLWEKMSDADRSLFPLSMKGVSWLEYYRNYIKGLRIYLFQDPLSTIDKAKTKMKRFEFVHGTMEYLFFFFILSTTWKFLANIAAFFVSNDAIMASDIALNMTDSGLNEMFN